MKEEIDSTRRRAVCGCEALTSMIIIFGRLIAIAPRPCLRWFDDAKWPELRGLDGGAHDGYSVGVIHVEELGRHVRALPKILYRGLFVRGGRGYRRRVRRRRWCGRYPWWSDRCRRIRLRR